MARKSKNAPIGLIVIHKVADYGRWLPYFEAHRDAHLDAGIVGYRLHRGVDDPNLIAILFFATDRVALRAFGESEDLRRTMELAGVLGQPELIELDLVEDLHEAGRPSEAVILVHQAESFERFKPVFDRREDARRAAGISGHLVGHDPQDPSRIVVYLQGHDLEALEDYVQTPEIEQARRDAGVKETPDIYFVHGLEDVVYDVETRPEPPRQVP